MDETNADELARQEKLNVLIKEKHIPVVNLDLYKPTQVVSKVHAKLPYKFTVVSHTAPGGALKCVPNLVRRSQKQRTPNTVSTML